MERRKGEWPRHQAHVSFWSCVFLFVCLDCMCCHGWEKHLMQEIALGLCWGIWSYLRVWTYRDTHRHTPLVTTCLWEVRANVSDGEEPLTGTYVICSKKVFTQTHRSREQASNQGEEGSGERQERELREINDLPVGMVEMNTGAATMEHSVKVP